MNEATGKPQRYRGMLQIFVVSVVETPSIRKSFLGDFFLHQALSNNLVLFHICIKRA